MKWKKPLYENPVFNKNKKIFLVWIFLLFGNSLLAFGCFGTGFSQRKEKTPNHSPSHIQEAQVYFEQGVHFLDEGKKNEAILAFQRAIGLNPHLAPAHNNVGVLLKQAGRFEKAKEYYQEAIRLNPSYPEVYNNLGILFREEGLFHEAEQAYLEAIRTGKNFPPPYFNLGILYDMYLNHPEKAIKNYVHYLQLDEQKRPKIEAWILDLEKRLEKEGPQAEIEEKISKNEKD